MTHRFFVEVDCSVPGADSAAGKYLDNAFIILPDNYSESGEPTVLVINCHGAGGTVTTDDSQVEHQVLTQYLVANGYAVMDTNGLPEEYASERGIDLRNNIGSPIAVRSYVAAYRYCMEHFHLRREVFVHGGSMGGISSANLVLCGEIPVIAHSAFCPVLDTYNEIFLHPWSGGLPKEAMGKIYGLKTDGCGEYIYDESLLEGYNPVATVQKKPYPVPVKFWHCEDDGVVSCDITRAFVAQIRKDGGIAFLRTFPNGGHEPQLVGERVSLPSGNTVYQGNELAITPAVEEAFAWIRSFDK